MNIRGITAQDNRVAAEVDGQFELRDGRSYGYTYHFLFVIENDRFVSVREHFDTARMKAFLGDEPPIALSFVRSVTVTSTAYLTQSASSDAGLEELAVLTSLRTLDLTATDVTDAGVVEL